MLWQYKEPTDRLLKKTPKKRTYVSKVFVVFRKQGISYLYFKSTKQNIPINLLILDKMALILFV